MDEQEKKDSTIEEKQTAQEIIDSIMAEKKNYEQSTQEERKDIIDIYDTYSGRLKNVVNTPYKNQETIPKLRTEVSFIKPFIFSGEPILEVEGVGDEDQLISKILEKIVNYRLSHIKNAYDKIEDWVHQAVTFGTSVIKVIWRFETKKNEDGTDTPIIDEPDLEVPNILDVYYNPIIADVQDQPSIIYRIVLPVRQVENSIYYNYQDEFGVLNRTKVKSKKSFSQNNYNSSMQDSSDGLTGGNLGDGLVEIYERYTVDRIQTIADGAEQLVLRDVPQTYGFINAVKFIFEKNTIPNRFAGLGVGHNTKGLGTLFYRLMNQTLDNVTLTNNPMFLFKKGANIDKRQLPSKPGGGIEVEVNGNEPVGNVIQPILFPDLKEGAVMMLNKLDDEHKRASGANDLVQGTASNDTLGQDQLAQANISNRFELIIRRFKHALAEVGEQLIQMEIKNMQDVNAPILRIFPQELRQEIYLRLVNEAQDIKFNVKVKGDTNVNKNKDMQSKRLVDLLNLSGEFLTDHEKRSLVRRIAERQGEDNIDEIIMENNPIADQQEQLMAEQQVAQTQQQTNMAMQPQGVPEPGTNPNYQ